MTVLAATVLGVTPALMAVGIPVAAAALVYAICRPAAMLVAMIVLEVTNIAEILAERTPVPINTAVLAAGLLTVLVALRDPVKRGRLNRGTLVCAGLMACYLVTQLLAMLGSQNVGVSRTAFTDAVLACLFLVVILVLTQLTGKPWTVAAAVVIPLAVLSVLCVVSFLASGGAMSFGGFANVTEASGQLATTPRFAGPLGDSNFWGRQLILAVPLTGALIVRSSGFGQRRVALAWSAAMLALLAGVYLTQSRGTLIAAGLAVVVWVLASGPTARRRGLMCLPLLALIVLVPGIGDRIVALAIDVRNPAQAVDPSVVGRVNAQEVAWAMFQDRPVFGFGTGLFELSVPRYAAIVDTATRNPADGPHNLYAQFAAESGVVGLVGWIVFVGGCIVYLALRLTRMPSDAAGSTRSLAAAVLAGLIAWSFASAFLHLAYFRTLAIVLALAIAVVSEAVPLSAQQGAEARRKLPPEVLATIFGVAVGAVILLLSTNSTHTASQKVTLKPTRQIGWDLAYALDIKTRDPFLPTYAAMMSAGVDRVTAKADSVRGIITLTVNDTDNDSARTDLGNALDAARVRLEDMGADSWYTVTPVGTPAMHVGAVRSITSSVTAVVVGTLVAAGIHRWLRRTPTRRILPDVAAVSGALPEEVRA
ncbi:O-antigen ligase family protein [Mycobacterium sp. ITM-2016-00317]|uniref:O-antigen ligase family protein n=1 Tax=Mycobacterium sp. ITM-2016-00317 TaxID=2099694 RepID=UPI00287FEAFD|nr:O-antigen ligase family protein [Mycobacterium sp. ITM-2016-00317]WNG86968.1 O-antigen ligase family protein [Mycobacterium sp. ITM-2016-00317]